jgi:hypothetical protein
MKGRTIALGFRGQGAVNPRLSTRIEDCSHRRLLDGGPGQSGGSAWRASSQGWASPRTTSPCGGRRQSCPASARREYLLLGHVTKRPFGPRRATSFHNLDQWRQVWAHDMLHRIEDNISVPRLDCFRFAVEFRDKNCGDMLCHTHSKNSSRRISPLIRLGERLGNCSSQRREDESAIGQRLRTNAKHYR